MVKLLCPNNNNEGYGENADQLLQCFQVLLEFYGEIVYIVCFSVANYTVQVISLTSSCLIRQSYEYELINGNKCSYYFVLLVVNRTK